VVTIDPGAGPGSGGDGLDPGRQRPWGPAGPVTWGPSPHGS